MIRKFFENRIRTHKGFIQTGLFCLMFLLCGIILNTGSADAATAIVRFDFDENTVVRAGDIFNVSVYVEVTDSVGRFECSVMYDNKNLSYIPTLSLASEKDGVIKIVDSGEEASKSYRKYVLCFKAINPGEIDFYISGKPVVVERETGKNMAVSYIPGKITIYEAGKVVVNENTGNVVALKHLVIEDTVLTPAFQSNVYSYEVTIPFKPDGTFDLEASAVDPSNTTVSVTGVKSLKVGNNDLYIVVSTATGTQVTYYVKVKMLPEVREEDDLMNPDNFTGYESVTDAFGLKYVLRGSSLFEVKDISYVATGIVYMICDIPEDYDVPEGYVKTHLYMNDCKVPCYVKQKDSSGDFVLLVLKTQNGEMGLYRYDRVEQTVQRYTKDELTINQLTSTDYLELQKNIEGLKEKQKILVLMTVVSISLFILMAAYLVVSTFFIKKEE